MLLLADGQAVIAGRGLDMQGLGLATLDTSLTIGMPAPTVESPLLVTPGCGTTRGTSSRGTTIVTGPSSGTTSIVSRSNGIA